MSLTTFSRQSPLRGEKGFSLIEVMVTIVIVSFGLLGLAGLLFSSVTAGQTSMSRTVAVDLANEMADRIRANWKAAKEGKFDAVLESDYADLSAGCTTTCMSGSCTPSEQAVLDICLWKAQLQKQLPAGAGSISANPDNPNLKCANVAVPCSFRVNVSWNESRYDSAASANSLFQNSKTSYSVSVQP